MSGIYLDHNSTTPLRVEARDAWLAAQDELGGNPSSLHAGGRRARDLMDRAREQVAGALDVSEEEVIFTSGGTESNNLALFGALEGAAAGAGLAVSAGEHPSVLETARALEARGHPLHVLPIDGAARLDRGALDTTLDREALAVISIQAANNEVGVVHPLAGVRKHPSASGLQPLLHVDAVQALGRVPVTLEAWGADLASFSAHKVGGPVGVGVLVRRKGAPIAPLTHGGEQESGMRPGTEDVAGCIAAACAIELAVSEQARYAAHTQELCRELWSQLASREPRARLLGPALDDDDRLPNTLNVLLPEQDGRMLVTRLDLAGLHTSAGSACASGSLEASHVLLAMGLDEPLARAGLRLSVGRDTSMRDVHDAVEILTTTVRSTHAS